MTKYERALRNLVGMMEAAMQYDECDGHLYDRMEDIQKYIGEVLESSDSEE